ncbi:hypothetical protein [Pararhizobium sp. O133]|uniref:hypothetical protein n=1 Tax=Pararhizobium sp. O133 TaxID=3449278 RepID=UPI003F689496
MPFLTLKFFVAVLPLLVLGYIFGTFVSAAIQGMHVNLVFVALNAFGIAFALWDFESRCRGR